MSTTNKINDTISNTTNNIVTNSSHALSPTTTHVIEIEPISMLYVNATRINNEEDNSNYCWFAILIMILTSNIFLFIYQEVSLVLCFVLFTLEICLTYLFLKMIKNG
jgi:hypothetical protein